MTKTTTKNDYLTTDIWYRYCLKYVYDKTLKRTIYSYTSNRLTVGFSYKYGACFDPIFNTESLSLPHINKKHGPPMESSKFSLWRVKHRIFLKKAPLDNLKYFDIFKSFCKELNITLEPDKKHRTFYLLKGDYFNFLLVVKVLRTAGPFYDVDKPLKVYRIFANIMKAYSAGVDPYNAIILGFQTFRKIREGYDPVSKLGFRGSVNFSNYRDVIPYISKEEFEKRKKQIARIRPYQLKGSMSNILGLVFDQTEAYKRQQESNNNYLRQHGLPLYRVKKTERQRLPIRLPLQGKSLVDLEKLIENEKWQEAYNYIGGPGVLTPRANGETL